MKYEEVIENWNNNADAHNQWRDLGEDEKVEFSAILGEERALKVSNNIIQKPWSEERRIQCNDLIKMLRKLSLINNGSDFIGQIQECISLATRLHAEDVTECKKSFVSFLVNASTGVNNE